MNDIDFGIDPLSKRAEEDGQDRYYIGRMKFKKFGDGVCAKRFNETMKLKGMGLARQYSLPSSPWLLKC